jgi:hypothetical protein
MGARARSVFEKLADDENYKEAVIKAADSLGDKNVNGFPSEVVERLRKALQDEFNAGKNLGNTVFDHELWKAMLQAAEDPDIDVPTWLKEGCPTGIGSSAITGRGIFPKVEGTSTSILASKERAKLQEDWQNNWRLLQAHHRQGLHLGPQLGRHREEMAERLGRAPST